MTPGDCLVYRFGEVEVSATAGYIRRGGTDQYVRRQSFQVLLYLLQHRDRLVGKEELRQAVWNDIAVGDDAIAHCIADLRRILGDDPRTPRYIKTVPKLGYRFVEPVTTEPRADREGPASISSDGEEEPRQVSIPSPRRSRFALTGLLAMVLLVAAVAAAAIWGRARIGSAVLRSASPETRVAVLYFDNQSSSDSLAWLRQGLADMVITDLSRFAQVAVLSRQELDRLVERMGLHNGPAPLTLTEALDVARRSQAQALVLGSFSVLGDTVRVELRLHDGATGRLLGAEEALAERPDQLLTKMDDLVNRLAGRMGLVTGNDDRRTGIVDVLTDNLQAYRNYSLGLDRSKGLQATKAIESFEKAATLDPQFAMAYARIGYVYSVTLTYPDRAKPYLEKAFELSGRLTDKDRAYIAGWYAIANKDYDEAIARFRDIVRRYPYEAEAYGRLGMLLLAEGRLSEAAEVLGQALTVTPDSIDVCNALGQVSSLMGQHDRAIALHRRYVELASAAQQPNAHDSLGMSYQWAGRYEEAIEHYKQSMALDPNLDVASVHLANTLYQLGRYRDAIAQYQRFIDAAPEDSARAARGYTSIGWVHVARNSEQEAWRSILRADALRGSPLVDDDILVALAFNDLQRAEGFHQHREAQAPGRGSRLTRRMDEYVEARMALARGRNDEAIARFKAALQQPAPTYAQEAHEDCLADAYLALGRLDEAAAEYERIVRLNPRSGPAHFHRAEIFDRRGNHEAAREAFARFLDVWRGADADAPMVVAARAYLGGGATNSPTR